jgi:molecular chaperone HtpG
MFEDFTLVINSNNQIIKNILSHEINNEKTQLLCNYVYDLARLAHKPLSGSEMQEFLTRSNQILKEIT